MFLLSNRQLYYGIPFTHNDIQYPANWLELATPNERAAIGIKELPDQPSCYEQFQSGWTPEGHPIWLDHATAVSDWSNRTRATAKDILGLTDWRVIRAIEMGETADLALTTTRQKIRAVCKEKIRAIESTPGTFELAQYIDSALYSSWPS
jgi:hypothetical protein